MDLLERYNALLRTTEDGTLTLLNRVLDQSFNRLVRRTRIHMRAGYADPAQRNLALLQDFRQLIPAYRPDRIDAYDRILRNLTADASARGLDVADQLTQEMAPTRDRIDVSIPLEATAAAAAQAKGYLRRHGETFATTSAEIVAQGIAEGRPTNALVQDMHTRLGVIKSRADAIVRTEALRAYNEASNQYYAAQGIDLCMWYATSDDRTCPICAPRAGTLYKRTEARAPCHPRCRCYLAPWDEDIAAMDPDYAQQRQRHRKEVAASLASSNIKTLSLNKASVFEQLAPTPYA
jgi:SPP1 gp7 family putative phage head morphogenesis protein